MTHFNILPVSLPTYKQKRLYGLSEPFMTVSVFVHQIRVWSIALRSEPKRPRSIFPTGRYQKPKGQRPVFGKPAADTIFVGLIFQESGMCRDVIRAIAATMPSSSL